jgi:hypothetical protein
MFHNSNANVSIIFILGSSFPFIYFKNTECCKKLPYLNEEIYSGLRYLQTTQITENEPKYAKLKL